MAKNDNNEHFGHRPIFPHQKPHLRVYKSNQGNQDSSRSQKNVIQGQRPDMENRYTLQRT